MTIVYYGPIAQPTGYGQACHDYLLALVQAGADVHIRALKPASSDDMPDRYAPLLDRVELALDPSALERETVRVVHTVPAHAWRFVTGDHKPRADVPRVAITTWETDRAPEAISASLGEHFDLVIVPTRFCAQALRGEGLEDDQIAVVPHTFNPGDWPLASAGAGSVYTFLSVLGWSERKNPVGLLKSFWSAFAGVQDFVRLIIVTPGYSEADVALLRECTELDDLPPVEFRTERLSHDELLALYEAAHAYVTATRGEGWNLPAFEAAIMGLPVIAPNWSGHVEFLSWYRGFIPVDYQLTPAVPQPDSSQQMMPANGARLGIGTTRAPTGITARQAWAEPNLWQLRQKMTDAIDEQWCRYWDQRALFDEEYGYKTVGPKLLQMLRSCKRYSRIPF